MREIKFCGKRIDKNQFVYGYYFKTPLTIENFGAGHLGDFIERHCISTDMGVVYAVIRETVGQFTGLVDKNGKEIYKGHIVLCNRHINDAFDKTTFLIGVDEYFRYQGVSKLGNEISVEEFEYAEIIGYIHDNPELLEVSNAWDYKIWLSEV